MSGRSLVLLVVGLELETLFPLPNETLESQRAR